MISVIEEWGSRLVAVSIVYTVIAMVVTYSSLASGYQPPLLVSPKVMQVYADAYKAWNAVSGAVINGSAVGYLQATVALLEGVFNTFLAATATITFSFIWLGYAVSSVLPPPLDVLRIPVWVAAFTANLIMMSYLVKKTYELLSSVFGRFIPVPSI